VQRALLLTAHLPGRRASTPNRPTLSRRHAARARGANGEIPRPANDLAPIVFYLLDGF
jgi:hypothetical protein